MKGLLCFGFLLVSYLGVGQVVDTARVRLEVDSLVKECRALTGKRQFEEALQAIGMAENLALDVFGYESAVFANCKFNHGRIYYFRGKINEAEREYLAAKDIQEKILGKWNQNYANTLNNLALLYYDQGIYEKAEPLFVEAREIRKKVLGEEHSDYAMSLSNLANLYTLKGAYEKAEWLYLEAKNIWAETLGKEHSYYTQNLVNIASLYVDKGSYEKAEFFYLESIKILAKKSDKENLTYANILGNLGWLYYVQGDYDKAESMYIMAKEIIEKTLGKEHSDNATYLQYLASLYNRKGEFEKAEFLHLKSKEIIEKTLGKEHLSYASILNNMAVLYENVEAFDKAQLLYLEAQEIYAKKIGKDNPRYARTLNNLARVYAIKQDFKDAESMFVKAQEIWAKVFGKEHPSYAKCLSDFANFYNAKGDFEKAEFMYLESKAIFEKIFGNEHPDYVQNLINLANLYVNNAEYEKSEPLFRICNNSLHTILQNAFAYNSEKEMLKYMTLPLFDKFQNSFFSFTQIYSTPPLLTSAYDNILTQNNTLLDAIITRENYIFRADSETQAIHSEWKSCHFQLNKWHEKPIAQRDSAIVARLEEKANQYEKELVRRSSSFAESRRQVSWQNVRQQLRVGEAAIEIIHYRYHDKKLTDSTMYSALILLPNDTTPHFIPLFEERQLDALIYKPNGTRANYLQNLYNAPRTDGLPSLYELVWAPIEKILKENSIKTVYYAPSGLLHRLNLAAIAPDKSGQTLADQYHLVPVASTRQLVTDHSEASLPSSAIIYGGVRYEMDSTAIARANKDLSATAQDTTGGLFRYAMRGGERADNWDTLPGTKREARYLYDLLSKRGVNATLRLGFAATEESFKQIGLHEPSPSLLHVGTHGFFFPDPKDTTRRRANLGDDAPVFKISEHPLIRSGLKLAGSKYAWENKRPMGGMEDGILTAYEVSQMNLSSTQLVVLSACETGLGDIKGNEGVYGLQRAFRIAGAKNVLMSLWKVPDEATEKLMTQFYKNWLEQKMPLRPAFEAAQKWLRGQKGYENPYFWAGFVLIGEL